MVKNDPSEQQIHNAIIAYLYRVIGNRALIHHSPNEGNRGGRQGAIDGARRKKSGVCPGWPDIEIIAGGKPYFIEVKRRKGVLSVAQRVVLANLEAQGIECCVARSVEDAERFLRQCGLLGGSAGMVSIERRGVVR